MAQNGAGDCQDVLAGELAVNEVLAGELPRPSFPAPLRETAPSLWNRLAGGALHHARVHLRRGDVVASSANLAQAVLASAEARLAAAGEWALNEKGIVERAGLSDAARAFTDLDPTAAVAHIAGLLDVE